MGVHGSIYCFKPKSLISRYSTEINSRLIMASTLDSYVNHTVCIITGDGRNFIGTLKGFDQTINLIIDDSHERVFSMNQGGADSTWTSHNQRRQCSAGR